MSDSKRDSKAPRKPFPTRYTDEPDDIGAGSSSSVAANIPLLDHYDGEEELPGYVSDVDVENTGLVAVVGGSGVVVGPDSGDDAPPEFERYRPEVKKIKTKLGMGDILTVSHDKHLNSDGEALYRWLLEESASPPRPEIQIQGYHTVSKRKGDKTETSTVTDFNLTISLRPRLYEAYEVGLGAVLPPLKTVHPSKKANRGGRWKTVATDLEEARTVRSWADQYCEDKSTLKEFIMKKSCEGWNLESLRIHIEDLIRATNYRGRIKVEFPVFETRVEVFPANRISLMRKNEYWRWFFYLTFLWIFAWPYLWFFTKRYHVSETVWNYAYVRPMSSMDPLTEYVWLSSGWGEAIKRAAKARRSGKVTQHDLEEITNRAESQGREIVRTPKTGNSTVDGALGFIAGVGAIANDMRLSRGELVGWGGDESW